NAIADVTITLKDNSSPQQTFSRTYSLQVTDPGAPMAITGQSTQNIPSTGGNTSALTVSPNPTPAGFTPVTWSIDSISPSVAGITLNNTTGQSTTLNVLASVPGGS